MLPRVQAGNPDVESITVTLAEPQTASTVVTGSHLGIGFSIDVTETLSVAPLVGVDPPQAIPHVESQYSTSVGSLVDWLIGTLIPVLDGLLLLGSVERAQNEDQVPGCRDEPAVGPARSGPAAQHEPAGADTSPVRLPADRARLGLVRRAQRSHRRSWGRARRPDQSGARLTIAGPGSLSIPNGEHDIKTLYRLQLWQLDPTPVVCRGRSTHLPVWTTTAPATRTSSHKARLSTLTSLPLHALQGAFMISAAAVETCGTDPSKVISTTSTKPVKVRTTATTATR